MDRKKRAYAGPFVVFMLFLSVAASSDRFHGAIGGVAAMYWVYPVQTLGCGAMLIWYWREYRMRPPDQPWLAVLIGVITLGIWIAPGMIPLLHQKPRLDGFNPDLFAATPALYWAEVAMRFIRLVVVVPILEELFWRGFLLRYIIAEDFDTVPMGTYSPRANILVALFFMLEHSMPDWPAALVAGFLYNAVAFRTKSLSSCIIAHAVTNGLLGLYIMKTKLWGFW